MSEQLFLIDGSSLIFRSFYAIRRLSTRDGRPTNAVFGTYKMMDKLQDTHRMARVAVVFDTPDPTFRHEAYAEYKANRPEPPPDLSAQFGPAKELLAAAGFPILELSGYEADDLIGTLALRAREAGLEVIIVTADKDMYQLVEEGVFILLPKYEDRLIDAEGVEEIFGVRPDQVLDVLALWGDPTDNIPGVPGIGEKGAKDLIRTYGSLEGAADHAGEIKRKAYREGLQNHMDQAILSRDLATIRRDVPFDADVETLKKAPADREKFESFCREYELTSLIPDAPRPDLESVSPEIVPWSEGVWDILAKEPCVGLSSSEDGVLLSDGGRCWEMPIDELSLKRLLTLPLAAHGLKPLVRKWGGRGFRVGDRWVDTAVAGYLLDPSGRVPALPKLARDRLRLLVPSEGPAAEALLAARLAPVLTKSLEELGMASLFRDVEMPLVSVLARMENAGIAVDVDHFRILHDEMEASLRALEKRIHEAAGLEFNPASPKQVGEVLFETLGLPATKKTSKTKSYSTDSEVLEKLRDKHPVVPLILEHRMLAKLRGTYVEPLPQWVDDVSGRIHAAFHQTVTATGRLSSSDPNLQNIPIRGEWGGRIRAGFVARKGALFAGADYSQIELRILAHLSDDPALLDAFEKGEDIHTRTASEVFNVAPDFVNPDMRREAKAVNFGILYGMGPFGLARELGVSMKDAKSFIEQYFERFPSVKSFLEGVEAQALEEEHVTTILGRRRLFPGLARTPQPRKAALLRQAVNASVQGSAADLIKKAMVAVEPRLPNGASLILQVHDELIVEAEDALADDAAGILKETMEGAMALKVPLSVGTATGRRWSDLK